jgi:ABC-2 type transport system ATP-binding protein
MSLGNKKKVGIIQGLLHSPKLIVLDEPTSGLDPLMQKKFFDIILDENKNGATVLFSSHILSEVQRICDKVAIIREGRIIQTQKISDLQSNSYKKVSFTIFDDEKYTDIQLDGVADINVNKKHVSFIYKGDCNLLLKEIAKYNLKDIDISDPVLEEIFMHYYS